MRQEEWEKLMRAQSKIYTQIKGEFDKVIGNTESAFSKVNYIYKFFH